MARSAGAVAALLNPNILWDPLGMSEHGSPVMS